jgi:DcuC family C4-dicarboxylate transporter
VTGALIGLAVTAAVVWLIIKKYQPHTVLLLAGLFLFTATVVLKPETSILFGHAKSTGWVGFDIFAYVQATLSDSAAGLGMIIMAAGGFAKYMDHIGATDAMVAVCSRPLRLLRAPYVVLAVGCAVGQIFEIFIPSAAGLAMLLLVTFFPTLVRLGVSAQAAAAMIGATALMDLGPAAATTNLAAKVAELDPTLYFVHYQIPLAGPVMLVVSVLTYFSARYFDRGMDRTAAAAGGDAEAGLPGPEIPALYALLPVIPLTLMLVFSPLLVRGIRLDMVSAMVIGAVLALACEMIRTRDAKAVLKGFMAFFEGMGQMFGQIVSLVICTQVFAAGLQTVGAVDFLIHSAQGVGFGAAAMTVVMCAIVILTAVVTGSGVAAFFSFGSLAPKIAASFGVPAASILVPMQFSAALARAMSPVAGVVIVVSGAGQCSPMEIVRRTAIPVGGGLLVVLLFSAFFV